MVSEETEPSIEVVRQERHDRLREEAKDAGAYRAELKAQGFSDKEIIELITHWQGWRWDDSRGAP